MSALVNDRVTNLRVRVESGYPTSGPGRVRVNLQYGKPSPGITTSGPGRVRVNLQYGKPVDQGGLAPLKLRFFFLKYTKIFSIYKGQKIFGFGQNLT